MIPAAHLQSWWDGKHRPIAILALGAIAIHVALRLSTVADESLAVYPLYVVLLLGGMPLVADLLIKLFRREFGSDLLAGISITTAVLLGEYLAGTLVVLMLSGGEAIESFAVRRASSVLQALAKRMPSVAHRKRDATVSEVDLDEIQIGDTIVVFPHEVCPVDGTVLEGHGVMDESYLTGEPYMMSKTPGSQVLSGAINGETALTIHADKLPIDSRYAKIMQVMRESEQHRPRIRRLGDQLGAIYTPVAVTLALVAWIASGEAVRFLAVLVVATPCPLLIAIPVAVIGSISLSARLGIIIKNPAILETIDTCRTLIFDKTGTLTYGRPQLTEDLVADAFDANTTLKLVASLERYSKHPLAGAVVARARDRGMLLDDANSLSERPGEGLRGEVNGHAIRVISRKQLAVEYPEEVAALPSLAGGLECIIVIDGRYAATYRFRDEPRKEGASFIQHLRPNHAFARVMIVSGDRESEVRYLANQVGIEEVYFNQSPEQKLELVRAETTKADTMFIGDGINDAPALTAATVGVAFGQNSDVTSEAADAVIMDSSLKKVDELLHVSHRLRSIALQSAVGGMALSLIGMFIAAAGYLPPVAGAVAQEIIDVVAVLNALRVAIAPKQLSDF
ncbi:MAG: cadmium-translocating P-type ATPase [Planctomycetia bacterium]|nr:cadmium-translocating P-type ATPase [Planctomycetia bacterium]